MGTGFLCAHCVIIGSGAVHCLARVSESVMAKCGYYVHSYISGTRGVNTTPFAGIQAIVPRSSVDSSRANKLIS